MEKNPSGRIRDQREAELIDVGWLKAGDVVKWLGLKEVGAAIRPMARNDLN